MVATLAAAQLPDGLRERAEQGFSVGFFRLEELLASMKRDAEVSPARLRRRKYINVALLVIDEVGFEPMTRQEASLLFRLVSYRYGRGSILITTNKGIRDWPEVLAGDEVLTTAVLDRLWLFVLGAHLVGGAPVSAQSTGDRDVEAALTRIQASVERSIRGR